MNLSGVDQNKNQVTLSDFGWVGDRKYKKQQLIVIVEA